MTLSTMKRYIQYFIVLASVLIDQKVKQDIISRLTDLKENNVRTDCPMIYHLDVSSMYPNIMITNRLQPDSMVQESDCAACDFNRPGKTCDRRLPWMWRGDFSPSKKDEYNMIRRTLATERYPGRTPKMSSRSFEDLPLSEQNALVKKRLSEYSRKIYHKTKETKTIEREAIVCQRENPFYANTVRDFRDRRYDYKNKQKVWKLTLEKIPKVNVLEIDEAKKMVILFDSLQLAHKVILNSFYGYVMRKGSRWYSMEMAGVTCLTGATIIQMARALVDRLGKPLELDTDGIWCTFPKVFPGKYFFKCKNGSKLFVSYPCAMLNYKVHQKFTNHQYQTLVDPEKFKYATNSENSIFFEVDGPYRAMILPTSKEEDKNLKKRYAVFNDDGSLAELKGFEIKRRGELKLIKIFQSQIFKVFLEGETLQECYESVARVADRWLDVIDSKGYTLSDDELIDLISENKSMSRSLEDYGALKSTSISTARRLAEFLGDQMTKDKGLNCRYIISARPTSAPVTERAIPVAIFSAEDHVKSHFLRRWLKDPSLTEFDPRDLIDWEYYRERLGSVIQKLITIPAALQKVANPVRRIPHPDWLVRRLARLENSKQQVLLDGFNTKSVNTNAMSDVTNKVLGDIEDISSAALRSSKLLKPVAKVVSKRSLRHEQITREELQTESLFTSLPPVIPKIEDDYVSWLQYSKQKWKVQRQARQRRRFLFGHNSANRTHNTGVGSFFRDQAESIFSKPWQILRLKQIDGLGEIKAWVMIDKKIQTVRINIRRQVYIEFKGSDYPDIQVNDCVVEKVHHTMPNGNISNNLFRVTMPEELYAEHMSGINGIFNHTSIKAVYESNIDITMQAVLQIGNSCQLDISKRGVLGRGLKDGFDLDSLVPSESSKSYLGFTNNSPAALKIMFICHIHSRDRSVWALFTSFEQEAGVFIYDSSKQQFPNMNNVYKEQFKEKTDKQQIENAIFDLPESLEFSVEQSDNLSKLKKSIYMKIRQIQSDGNGQVMLALLSSNQSKLEKDFPSICDMPVFSLKSSATDNSMPTLGWQLPVARRIVLHYLGLGKRVEQLIQLARYSHIPIGNLQNDDPKYIIDVLYARKLRAANVLLWWSSSAYPDHGGAEIDRASVSGDNFEFPVINNPGSYHSVCIEMSMQNITINTVLTSALINELEGGTTINNSAAGSEGLNETSSMSFIENASSVPAITILRNLVKQWWEEAIQENENADIMVNNFVAWVSSPSSYLYDPALQYHVQNLSRKAFLQLLAEFRRVGSKIIFAEQNRLLIQTTKSAVANAYAYAHYIVKRIRSKSLFHFLDLEIVEYWDYLIWMDNFNYGGLACQQVTHHDQQELTLYTHWQIKKFLSPILQSEFQKWVEEFIQGMHNVKGEDFVMSTPRLTPTLNQSSISESNYYGKGIISSIHKPLKKRIQQLLRLQMDASQNDVIAEEFQFPQLAGSYLQLSNPTLELVKSLCAVYGLAADLNIELRQMRRDLLNLLDIREFSDEGTFRNPCTSLKLAQICEYCNSENHLDFCKIENHILPETNNGEGITRQYSFSCKYCDHEFDRLILEERLIGDVLSLVNAYQTQDLQCSRCKHVRGDNLSSHCSCSGSWTLTLASEDTHKKFDVYRQIASYFSLKMLQDFMESI